MKRTFRSAATVAGLIERNMPGLRKTGRQATFSSDILYDTLRKYDPDHLLLAHHPRRGRARAGRLRPHRGDAGAAAAGRIDLVRAPHVTPLAAPLFLEMGRVPIRGRARGAAGHRGRGRPARRGRPGAALILPKHAARSICRR